MPVTIKSSVFQYKNTNGEYVGVDAIADKTTAEQVAQVNSAISAKITEMASATATNISAIETKGQQTLNSIPEDYTELSEDVENLNSALNGIREHTKNLFDPSNVLNAYFTTGNIKSNDATRMVWIPCEPSTTYTISKTAGTRFNAAYTSVLPAVGVTPSGLVTNYEGETITITTGDEAAYLVSWVYNGGSDTGTAENMLSSVQIELGSSATSYIPPFSAIDRLMRNGGLKYSGIIATGTDLNDISDYGYYSLVTAGTYDHDPAPNKRRSLFCAKLGDASMHQIMFCSDDGIIYQRVYINTSKTWYDWKNTTNAVLSNQGVMPNGTDLNTLYGEDGFYTMGINSVYQHDPVGSGNRRLLVCYTSGGTFTHQILFNSSNGKIYQRVYASGDWSDWKFISNDTNLADGSAEQVRFPLNATFGGSSNPYSPYDYQQKVVTLLHFSDIHEAEGCFNTFMYWANENPDLYDDILCTGDLVNYYNESTGTDYMAYWRTVKNAENILVTIGNHDAKNQSSSGSGPWERKTLARSRELYMYGIDGWGVTSPSGTTWWYKDYENSDLRLIGLDTTVVENGEADTAQKSWLTNLLADSRTNGKAVVIAQHYQPYANTTKFPCDFTADHRNPLNQESLQMPGAYYSIVQDFIDNNGKFVCWLAGHQHCDYVLYNSEYPDQMFFVVTSLWNDLRLSDQARTEGKRSFVAANLIGFDTERKLIKISRVGANYDFNMRPRNVLVYNYETKTIVRQSSGTTV